MKKKDAIGWYKRITDGEGVERHGRILNIIGRGDLAVQNWENPIFTLGIEYGVMIAIVHIFDLIREDIEKEE